MPLMSIDIDYFLKEGILRDLMVLINLDISFDSTRFNPFFPIRDMLSLQAKTPFTLWQVSKVFQFFWSICFTVMCRSECVLLDLLYIIVLCVIFLMILFTTYNINLFSSFTSMLDKSFT